MKKNIIFIIMFIISINVIYAVSDTTVYSVADNDGDNIRGNSDGATMMFNGVTTASKSVATQYSSVRVADLDNDTINEIIVPYIVGTTLYVKTYRDNTLTDDSVTSSAVLRTNVVVNWEPLVHDYDGDGLLEFIIPTTFGANISVAIYNYSGTTWSMEQEYSVDNAEYQDGQVFVNCNSRECLMVAGEDVNSDNGGSIIYAGFNSSNMSSVDAVAITADAVCFNPLSELVVKDYDSDGLMDMQIGFIKLTATTDTVYIYGWEENSTGLNWILDRQITVKSTNALVRDGTNGCFGEQSGATAMYSGAWAISNILVDDFDSPDADGELETIITYKISDGSSEVETAVYDAYDNLIANYPKTHLLLSVEKPWMDRILGMVKADVFTEGKSSYTDKETEFCTIGLNIWGYVSSDYCKENHEQCLNIWCSSLVGESSDQTLLDNYDLQILFPLDDIANMSAFSGASQVSYSGYSNKPYPFKVSAIEYLGGVGSASEFLTPYGVIYYDIADVVYESILHTDYVIASRPKSASLTTQNGWLTAVDPENMGLNDLIEQNYQTIKYHDDGYINLPVYDFCEYSGQDSCSYITVTPCFDLGPIKTNTSLLASITPQDYEGDRVRAKATLYYNTVDNQTTGWSNWYSSGNTIDFNNLLYFNKTYYQATLKIEITDEDNPNDIKVYSESYSVADSGNIEHDCQIQIEGSGEFTNINETDTDGDGIPDSEDTDSGGTGTTYQRTLKETNQIKVAMEQIDSWVGVGWTIIWLFFMLIVSLAIFIAFPNLKNTEMILLVTNIILVIIGVWSGALAWGIVIIFGLFGLWRIGIMFKEKMVG